MKQVTMARVVNAYRFGYKEFMSTSGATAEAADAYGREMSLSVARMSEPSSTEQEKADLRDAVTDLLDAET